MAIEKNKELVLEIDGYTSQGLGVAHTEGRAVFIPRVIAGELCRVLIVKVTASEIYGKCIEILKTSPRRAEDPCPAGKTCGGCQTGHMCYEEELEFKRRRVIDALERLGGISVPCDDTVPSDRITAYRNKAVFDFARSSGVNRCGFYRGRTHDIVECEECLIQNPLANRTAAALKSFMEQKEIPAYDESARKGTVRHLFTRNSSDDSSLSVCIVTASGFGTETDSLCRYLKEKVPEISGITLCVNKSEGNEILSGRFFCVYGEPMLPDVLCGLRFKLSPRAFYQVNHNQAEKLYNKAVEYASSFGDGLAIDMYCGAGTISLCLARRFSKVIGCEIIEDAVINAKENAVMNGISNAEFICADASLAAEKLASDGLEPDAVVVDPPRKGLAEDVIYSIVSMNPKGVVYVSCNPATLARDLAVFERLGYRSLHATPFDLFPRTCHVETVVLMSKR